MRISKFKFYIFATVIPLAVVFLFYIRPPEKAAASANIVITTYLRSYKGKSTRKFLPLIDLTPSLTGEDDDLFRKSFNTSNKVYKIIITSTFKSLL